MARSCIAHKRRFFRCKTCNCPHWSWTTKTEMRFLPTRRQTMVLVFYLLCIVSMMTIRPCLNRVFLKKGKTAIYNSLYFVPVLSLFHTVAGGLICEWYQWPHSASKLITFLFYNFADYSFPYLSVIISMISNAAHFSLKLDQSMKSLILSSVKEMKNTVVISMYNEAMLYYSTRSIKLCQHCILGTVHKGRLISLVFQNTHLP